MKNTLAIIFILIFGLFIYILTLRGSYGNPQANSIKGILDQATKPLELSPERGRYILTMSLAQDKSFSLSKELADAASPDVGYYKGKYYVYFAPGISLLALPLYLVGRPFQLSLVGAFFTISLFSVLSMVALFKIARNIFKLPVWASLFVPIVFAFGSTSWSYAITLYQHHVTTFFILSSFYAVWKYKQDKKWNWVWALLIWTNFGYGLLVDYPNAFLLLPVMVYFLFSSLSTHSDKKTMNILMRPSILITSVMFIILIVLHGYYNAVNFGSWKSVSGGLVGIKTIEQQNLLETQAGEATLKKIAEAKQPIGFFKETSVPFGFYTLTVAIDRGLLLFSPIFVISILGIITSLKRANWEISTLLATIGINFFLYSSWGDPWGGWAYGPRYLIPSMAVLSIFAGVWLYRVKYKLIAKIGTFILFIYSSAIALLGALTTNQVPPKVEADYLHMQSNFMQSLIYFKDGRSGSFVYNTFFSHSVSLLEYAAVIYVSVLCIMFIILFILPIFDFYEPKN